MANDNDLFGNAGGGGSFPKVAEFENKLVLIKPVRMEQVAKPASFGGKPGELQDRLTADVTVFEDDGTWETFEDMYLSQTAFVSAGKKHLKPNAKPFILGRVIKVPSKIGKAQAGKFDTTEKINKGIAEWLRKGGTGEKPNHAWGIDDHTDEDKATAMKYLASVSPVGNASDD